MPITIRQATKELSDIGIALRHIVDTGEYRVNFKNGKEATAYYATDLEDAIATGHMMAARKEGHSR